MVDLRKTLLFIDRMPLFNMAEKTTLLLIRHAKTESNAPHKFQGRQDSGLSELGIRQAFLPGNALKGIPISAVYTSPLRRAMKTAELAFAGSVPVIVDNALAERSFGVLEGITRDDATKITENAVDFYHGMVDDVDIEGVERLAELQERSFEALQRIASENEGKTVALVTHVFWIKGLLCKLNGVKLTELRGKIGNTSITTIGAVQNGNGLEYVVEKIGEKSHLSALG